MSGCHDTLRKVAQCSTSCLITYDHSVPIDPAETNLQPQHAELERELRERRIRRRTGSYAGRRRSGPTR